MIPESELRIAADLRVETIDDEVVVLDPPSGVVFRLEGAAARLVSALHVGGTPDPADLDRLEVIAALREAHILVTASEQGPLAR
jgi:hypothetical protein